jgi:hypothetical protein
MKNSATQEVLADIRRVAQKLGVPVAALTRRQFLGHKTVKTSADSWMQIRAAAEDDAGPFIERSEIPDDIRPVDELIEARRKEFSRRQRRIEATENYVVKVRDSRPIGCWVFGDPHIDDPGCNIELLLEHAKKVRETPGLFAAGIGDTTNNWVGRLSKLYAEQSTTAHEGFELAKYWMAEVRDWLFLIKGNHDVWFSECRDPLSAWFKTQSAAAYQHEIGLTLEFDNGSRFRVNARHTFRGHSQWNPAHASTKSVRMEGGDWHLKLSGHTHITGYSPTYTPDTKRLTHCIQVGSYKQFDHFQEESGFVNQNWSPGCFVLFDPLAQSEVGKVQVLWDIDLGIQILNVMRNRREGLPA